MARWISALVFVYFIGVYVHGGGHEITRYSIDSGGGMHSSGGAFQLSGTVGQPDAGVMAGGPFQLTGGFWFQIPPADCNEDGIANLLDHTTFTECLSGPSNSFLSGCECFDMNLSGAVDLRDFSVAQNVFSRQ